MIKSFNLVENVITKNKFQLFSFGRLGQPVADLWQTFYKGLIQNGLLADFSPYGGPFGSTVHAHAQRPLSFSIEWYYGVIQNLFRQ